MPNPNMMPFTKKRMLSEFSEALIFATRKHDGQTRKDKVTPYIIHPLRVACLVKHMGYDDEYQITALLHDILEDTDTDEEELGEFGENVIEAVKLLTRKPGMDEEEYVNNILANPIAKVVKECDKLDNLKDCISADSKFRKKYLEKAEKYYYGKFTEKLDRRIDMLKLWDKKEDEKKELEKEEKKNKKKES